MIVYNDFERRLKCLQCLHLAKLRIVPAKIRDIAPAIGMNQYRLPFPPAKIKCLQWNLRQYAGHWTKVDESRLSDG